MPEDVRERVTNYKRDQMDKRKRDRDERLGIPHEQGNTGDGGGEGEEEGDRSDVKKRKKGGEGQGGAGAGGAGGAGAKGTKGKADEKQKEKEAEEERKRTEVRRNRFHKYCLDGEYTTPVAERDCQEAMWYTSQSVAWR